MPKSNLNSKPAYTSKLPIFNSAVLFASIFLGFIGLGVYIPIILFLIYMLVEKAGFYINTFCTAGLTVFTAIGIWFGRLLLSEIKSKLAGNRHPSGYDLSEDGLSYRLYNMQTKRFTTWTIPYSAMEKCVVSRKGWPRFQQGPGGRAQVKHYYCEPVAHIIYRGKGSKNHYTVRMLDDSTANDLLGALQAKGIPLEMTEYDLSVVPDERLVRVLEGEIPTTTLPFAGNIAQFVDRTNLMQEPPETYTKAYFEWLAEKRGIVRKSFAFWQLFALQALLFLPMMWGLVVTGKPSILLTLITPYVVVSMSYVGFVYRLKKAKYWKTFIHAAITLAMFLCMLVIFGSSSSPVVQEVWGTMCGVYIGSFVPYLLAKRLREQRPAKFHDEFAEVTVGTSEA